MNNWLKTTILMAAIMALFVFVGGLIGGKSGMLLALLFGGAMNIFAWNSDKMVLRMYNAHEVDESTAPELLPYGARTGRQCRLANAARLRNRGRSAKCLRHRTRPGTRGRHGDNRHHARSVLP